MDIQSIKEAKHYNKIKIRLKLIDLAFVILFLIFFQIFLSSSLTAFAFSLTPNFYYALTIYLIFFSFFYYVVNFPLHFYLSFVVEHKFKLSNQSFPSWIKDDIKSGLLSGFVFFIFIQMLYIFLRYFSATWWIWMAFFWFFATVIIAKITPTIILPLFFKYSEVEERLKSKIIALAKKCRINILNVYKIDFSKKTRKLNAAVIGLGRTRRVILADNLINDFNDEEVAGVLAHEFGHHKFFHMWKLLTFGMITTVFSFFLLYIISSRVAVLLGAEGIYDIKLFPAVLLILFMAGFLITPLQNGFSRALERRADRFALEVTGDKASFISLMNKLARRNLADPNPSKLVRFLFYDHPSISERIRQAEAFE